MVPIGTITYWCYISAVLVQGMQACAFITDPPRLVAVAADSYAQFFIRVTGICLLCLTQFFWGFRHVPFQAQSGVDAQLASYSHGCARVFTRFHTMMALLMSYASLHLSVSLPHAAYVLGLHVMWASVMSSALVMHHHTVHGYIIDTSSVPAAVKSFKELVLGEEDEQRTILQRIQGEDSSSKTVMQLFQGSSTPSFLPSFLRHLCSLPSYRLLFLIPNPWG